MTSARPVARHAARLTALVLLGVAALQLAFLVRIAWMAADDPRSTTFQRSEIWRLLRDKHQVAWSQAWVDYEHISDHLKRAVIASEDAGFVEHGGVDWQAVERAWSVNQRAQQRVDRSPGRGGRGIRLRGGSTITQQLAKNLLLSGERTLARKAQELVLTWMLEAVLSKRRLLELYLNHVEWGEGLFGAQAAARYYFRVDAARLNAEQSARLAVMLPAPKRFERQPASDYVRSRSATIMARMGEVELP